MAPQQVRNDCVPLNASESHRHLPADHVVFHVHDGHERIERSRLPDSSKRVHGECSRHAASRRIGEDRRERTDTSMDPESANHSDDTVKARFARTHGLILEHVYQERARLRSRVRSTRPPTQPPFAAGVAQRAASDRLVCHLAGSGPRACGPLFGRRAARCTCRPYVSVRHGRIPDWQSRLPGCLCRHENPSLRRHGSNEAVLTHLVDLTSRDRRVVTSR